MPALRHRWAQIAALRWMTRGGNAEDSGALFRLALSVGRVCCMPWTVPVTSASLNKG
jgi:hypothetical protein